jgi:hypothetical protein
LQISSIKERSKASFRLSFSDLLRETFGCEIGLCDISCREKQQPVNGVYQAIRQKSGEMSMHICGTHGGSPIGIRKANVLIIMKQSNLVRK